VAAIGWLVDGAAILNQTMLARCSYGPYARAMLRICGEESFHMKQGKEQTILLSQGTPRQREMIQGAIDRWWWPSMMMFGPHDSESSNSEKLIRWGVKTKTNDELRQTFVDQLVPELHALGLSVPDPDLKYNEATRNWDYGEIDWDEFWRVIKGDGPCNAERMAARRGAHEEGAWVREAMAAHARRSANGGGGNGNAGV
jgi:ring-1,2-phenylacetyl-CoA epoxidase subunit PaaA